MKSLPFQLDVLVIRLYLICCVRRRSSTNSKGKVSKMQKDLQKTDKMLYKLGIDKLVPGVRVIY